MAVSFFKSRVLENTKLNYKFHSLTFKIAGKVDFSFKPGQFVIIKVADGTFRSYSVASTPEQLPNWEIFIDVTPDGPGYKLLKNLKPGDIIESSLPRGVFTLGADDSIHKILVPTGCGLASIRPMLKTILAKNDGTKVYLLWGLRYEKDIVYKETLDDWQEKYPNFSYEIVLSKPEDKWDGKTGHTTDHIIELIKKLPPETASVYLCGNQGLVTDVKEALSEIDFPAERLYFERYY